MLDVVITAVLVLAGQAGIVSLFANARSVPRWFRGKEDALLVLALLGFTVGVLYLSKLLAG